MCSTYVDYFKFNSQHNWESLYDQLMSMSIFTLTINKILVGAPTTTRQMHIGMIWIFYGTIYVFHIIREVSAKVKSI